MSWRRRALHLFGLALLPAGIASAQVIPVKTVPLADGDQSGFLPRTNVGMADVSIAVADSLLDPFVNPAKASRLDRGVFFGSPTVYSVSRSAGSGRTLPLGAIFRSHSAFLGFAAAIQELTPAGGIGSDVVPVPAALDVSIAPPIDNVERRVRSNQYLSGVAALRASSGFSFGGSASWSRLAAVDGVDLLYVGHRNLQQSGDALDLRLGVTREWAGGRSIEAVAVHNRFAVEHDVLFMDLFWDPGTRQMRETPRLDHNLDRSITSGVHLEYAQPVADSAWRLGALLTANRISHSELPDYAFANVPRDAGHSTAFNLGVGFSKSDGPAMFGLDLIYEPIWTRTGTSTVENRFVFSNTIVRAGLSRDFAILGGNLEGTRESVLRVQLGMQLRSVAYDLERRDAASSTATIGGQSWREWTRTAGAVLRLPEFDFHYRLRLTNGVGRPQAAPFFGWSGAELFAPGPIPGPGPQTLLPVRVLTQQLSVSVPIR